MTLHPRVGRSLYRALQRSSAQLERELVRCGAMRTREMDALKRSASSPLPKELRGLLDVTPQSATRFDIPICEYVSIVARRIADAALSPQLEGLEGQCGFAALRHIHNRLAALEKLVYETTSDALTHGVRVEVASRFQDYNRSRFMFEYQIRISNSSHATIQLLSRAWTIVDLDGRISSVEGPGVVGNFPILAPQEKYEYTSGVPLQTPMGTQSGYFVFHQHSIEPCTPNAVHSVSNSASSPDVTNANNQVKPQTTTNTPTAPSFGRILHVRVAPFSYRSPSLDERSEAENLEKPQPTSSAAKSSPRGRRRRTDENKRR